MPVQATILLALSALLTASANLMLRHGLLEAGGFSFTLGGALRLLGQPWFVSGVVAYGLAALVWFRVLSIAEVSGAYPVLVGMTFCLVTVAAVLVFRESLSWPKIVGILLILAGIVTASRA